MLSLQLKVICFPAFPAILASTDCAKVRVTFTRLESSVRLSESRKKERMSSDEDMMVEGINAHSVRVGLTARVV